jgi:hypothetical protein
VWFWCFHCLFLQSFYCLVLVWGAFVSFQLCLFMAMLIPLLISFLISLLFLSFLQIVSCGCLCLARGFSCYHIGTVCCG